jgi:hypothetical protein
VAGSGLTEVGLIVACHLPSVCLTGAPMTTSGAPGAGREVTRPRGWPDRQSAARHRAAAPRWKATALTILSAPGCDAFERMSPIDAPTARLPAVRCRVMASRLRLRRRSAPPAPEDQQAQPAGRGWQVRWSSLRAEPPDADRPFSKDKLGPSSLLGRSPRPSGRVAPRAPNASAHSR